MTYFRTLITVLSITFSLNVFCQTPAIEEKTALYKNKSVEVKGDERVEKLEQKYVRINEEEKKIDGYRIQLFSSSGPESWTRANLVQTEFLKIYPDIDAYVIHIKPSFRVRIGDYRTRLEAERFYIEIKENFPDAFIVRDRINFPVLGIEKEEE